jgi:hypothetical protein
MISGLWRQLLLHSRADQYAYCLRLQLSVSDLATCMSVGATQLMVTPDFSRSG